MKKILVLLLACLMLAGCGSQHSGESTPTTPDPTTNNQPEPVGLYDPNSAVGKATGGAVRAYPLGDSQYVGLLSVGSDLLVISGQGNATLLSGDTGHIVATAAVELSADYAPAQLRYSNNTIAYYVPESRQVVLLDSGLQELSRITLPEGISGNPTIHLGQQEIFYCIGNEIRALSIQTGISRLVRSHSGTDHVLVGSYFNDTVLGCRLTDEEGQQKIVYLYSETGRVVHTDTDMATLYTAGQDYFTLRNDGNAKQVLFGSAEGETMCLNVKPVNLVPALELGGAVQYANAEQDLTLTFYDFASGSRYAEVTLPGVGTIKTVCADENYLWLLCGQVLYRWDITASLTGDETVCVGNLYTAQNPDLEGLSQCLQQTKAIYDRYGITVRFWQDAMYDDCPAEAEYQVSVIRSALDELEIMMQVLPDGFLRTTGNLEIDLVRSVSGSQEAVQFRDRSSLHIMIPCQNVRENFLWGLGWAVDTRVLGNSRDYDFWDTLNPRGFAYTYNYETNAQREDAADYVHAFVDQDAMSYPSEDRARLFSAAILSGNEELFQSKSLQAKLKLMCQAIREAYGMDDYPEMLPWEQYLDTSLAKSN